MTRPPLPADDDFEKNFRANYPFLWKATLFGPLLLTVVILGILYITMGPAYVHRLVATTASFRPCADSVCRLGGMFLFFLVFIHA